MNTTSPLPHEVWERTPAEAQAYIRALEARVAALEATVQRLLERLRMDSQNSSQPPSSDPPATRRPRQRRTPSGRKPGGQPGHHGQTWALVPLEDVEAVLPVKPTHCARCQHPLHGEDSQPHRHQVTELPPVQPVVTEYQLHSLVCPACGATTQAPLPVGVPTGAFGPRVQALVALCTGASHLSKRTTQNVMADLCGISVRLGSMANLEHATVQALAVPVAEAQTHVRAQSMAHLDETGWREGHARAWLWVAVTAWVTVFVVRLSRGAKVAQELLGERFCGILVTDRWSAYTWYPTRWRQVCWAHLLRDFAAMIERGGRSQEIGEGLREQAHQMFHCVASRPRWQLDARPVPGRDATDPTRSRTVAPSRPDLRCSQDGRGLSRDTQGLRRFVDLCAGGRRRTDQQCGGARDPSGCPVAQRQLWDAECPRVSVC